MTRAPLYALLLLAPLACAYVPPEDIRHNQLVAMQSAFSRFSSGGVGGSIAFAELPEFVRFVVTAMNSDGLPAEKVSARSTELTQRLMTHLPKGAERLTLTDVLRATEKIIVYPQPSAEELSDERGQQGSKQLRTLRRRLEENRLTMPLFDTRGWVRDFEKALKIQWEIYSNGLKPMHIVVGRSDRIYGVERWPGVPFTAEDKELLKTHFGAEQRVPP